MTCANLNLCDPVAARESLRSLSTAHVIELAIVNAGVSQTIGRGKEAEYWEVAKALLGLECNPARIVFPRGLAIGTWGLSVLPATLPQRISRTIGFGA